MINKQLEDDINNFFGVRKQEQSKALIDYLNGKHIKTSSNNVEYQKLIRAKAWIRKAQRLTRHNEVLSIVDSGNEYSVGIVKSQYVIDILERKKEQLRRVIKKYDTLSNTRGVNKNNIEGAKKEILFIPEIIKELRGK